MNQHKLDIKYVIDKCANAKNSQIAQINSSTILKSSNSRALIDVMAVNGDIYFGSTNYFIAYLSDIKSNAITCCNETSTEIYERIVGPSVIIDGCADVNPGVSQIGDKNAFVVLDNHKNISILRGNELKSMIPEGITTNVVKGILLLKNGKCALNVNKMKDLKYNGVSVDGKRVHINYADNILTINGDNVPFSAINKTVIMTNMEQFELHKNIVVVGVNDQNKIIIFYFEEIDIYNLCMIVNRIKLTDAVIICLDNDVHIMWKLKVADSYTPSNEEFIGNPTSPFKHALLINL